jgi:hypothetical protein
MEAEELVLEEVVDLVLDEPTDAKLEEIYLDEAVEASAQTSRAALPSQQSVASEQSSASKPVPARKAALERQLIPPALAEKSALPALRPSESQPTQPIMATLPVDSPPAASAPESALTQTLSKFRQVAEAVAAEEVEEGDAPNSTSRGANELGRIPLVRVRKGRDGPNCVSYLARLLANF